MNRLGLLRLVVVFCLVSVPAFAQQSGPQTPQAASIIQQSIAAMTGGVPVTDVTMTGTATTTISVSGPSGTNPATGSNSESGTVTLVATATGQGKSIVTTAAGTRTEIRDISTGSPTLTETGFDGVTHTVTTQSALSPHPAWFYAAFVLSSGLSSPNYASSYVGPETWNGASVQHIAVWLLPNSASVFGQFLQRVTQHDIYLDSSTFLPVGVTFTVHPYDATNPNAPLVPYRGNTVDTLEQIVFSHYQSVQGRQVALHIHTSLQAELVTIVTDTELSSVTFNSGATIAAN